MLRFCNLQADSSAKFSDCYLCFQAINWNNDFIFCEFQFFKTWLYIIWRHDSEHNWLHPIVLLRFILTCTHNALKNATDPIRGLSPGSGLSICLRGCWCFSAPDVVWAFTYDEGGNILVVDYGRGNTTFNYQFGERVIMAGYNQV